MDLPPLIREKSLDVVEYVDRLIDHFADDVRNRLKESLGVRRRRA